MFTSAAIESSYICETMSNNVLLLLQINRKLVWLAGKLPQKQSLMQLAVIANEAANFCVYLNWTQGKVVKMICVKLK